MTDLKRRYDIDWLRVIAIGLLLIYHIGIAFQPWGVFIGFIQSAQSLEGLWIPMSMLNVWRIPLLFFVSGMGVCFAIRKRSWSRLILERTLRILVPFIFGIFCIVPIHLLLWQSYYSQDLTYTVHPVHLWFLANIFIYVVILAPVFFYLKKKVNGKLKEFLVLIFRSPLGMFIIATCFALEVLLVNPETYETYAMTLHGFLLGLLAFFFGYLIIYTGDGTRRTFIKWRWITFIFAGALFAVRYSVFELKAPGYLLALESNMWIFTLFGFAFRSLNRPGKVLAYLSQAAYPVYILHMIFLYLGSVVIMPLEIPATLQFILIVVFTFAGCLLTYEFFIRRVIFLRPVFGLKIKKKTLVMKAHNNKYNKAMIKIAILSLLFMSCEKFDSTAQYTYQVPQDIGDGISISTLEEVGLDTPLILKAADRIASGKHKEVHSMLIFKDNMLVFEDYFPGHDYQYDAPGYHGKLLEWDKEMRHPIMSCTKSFTSACIGIAVDKGFINNVDQSIFDYLPDHQYLKIENKEFITIEHLLTMSSGLAWNEWGSSHGENSSNDIDRLYFDCEDPIDCVLSRPWWAVPGEKFTYNGGGIVILGEILKNATGMNIDDFSMKYLFEPLSIDSAYWWQYRNGMIGSDGSLSLTPRDMLKFGATFLNDGIWNGERIISSDWIEHSSTSFANNTNINIPIEDSGRNGYAYTWWTSEFSIGDDVIKMYRAGGWGGQSIMVFPDLEMVVVFTGGNFAANSTLFKIVERFLIPAVGD